MADTSEHRRLAAIMFTDMVGYSALTQRNEALALELLEEHQCLLRPIFGKYGGRAVKSIGDGFLVEFASALQAVRCAIEIQKGMVQRNSSEAPERRIQIRIGLHLGDIETRDGDVFGDGVNIAARIEPLAEAGGICISGPVFDQIRNKIDAPLVRLGQPELKNIQVPIDVYRVVLPWQRAASSGVRPQRSHRSRTTSRPAAVALLVTIFIVGGMGSWLYYQHAAPSRTEAPPQPNAPTPVPHGEDRKSIAVLPFVNMSAEAADEYLSDGMTEEIITALSKISELRVAARTSSFAFKGKNEEIERIGEQLHVGTVLEGSVRKAGNKLRITAQLINVGDGYHLWSNAYEKDLADIFAIQVEVAQRVADALQIELGAGARQQISRPPTENAEAYQLYLKGRYHVSRYTMEGLNKGADYFRQAIALDPGYALAYSGLAYYYVVAADWIMPTKEAAQKTREAAQKALALDDSLADGHAQLGTAYSFDWDWKAAEREYQRALTLDPRSAAVHEGYGWLLVPLGRYEAGIAEFQRAIELDPLSPEISAWLGVAFYLARLHEQAIVQLRQTIDLEPSYWFAHLNLGRAYAEEGKLAEAIAALRTARQLQDMPETAGVLTRVLAMSGQRDEAVQLLDELRERSTRTYVPSFDIAIGYLGLGDRDRAFEWLDKAYEERSYYLCWLKVDPTMDSLRSDPRFTALLKKVGLEP